MNSKRAGILLFITVLTMIAGSFIFYKVSPFFGNNIIINMIFSQGIILVPAVGMVVAYEYDAKELMSAKRLGLLTALCVIFYTICITPTIVEANVFSQLFVANEVAGELPSLSQIPTWMILAVVGVLGPICEELVFRGVFYGSFRRSGHIVGAMVLQALLFGLFHGNLNQFSYAFLIGIAMAAMVEASGTILSSIMMHIMINSFNVIMLCGIEKIYGKVDDYAETAQNISAMQLLGFCAVILPFALLGLFLARLIIRFVSWINDGNIWKKLEAVPDDEQAAEEAVELYIAEKNKAAEANKEKTSMFSVWLVLGMLALIAMLVFDTVMQNANL